ncbi:uncharacterized protein UV8b_04411 [Ustilaginoidea virens]|uniref:Uncharacterized protein n=1 Tax=Ustilaginoidea virens TaxID=1159556 RepID=A0A8E5HR82_USTVR|nr:uncharacterized protein UV8b_04411 [Ustilaginoidea virens]QUC20170.1 hypothetical protein UV8b_04411 [Ustilaginoidea virens]
MAPVPVSRLGPSTTLRNAFFVCASREQTVEPSSRRAVKPSSRQAVEPTPRSSSRRAPPPRPTSLSLRQIAMHPPTAQASALRPYRIPPRKNVGAIAPELPPVGFRADTTAGMIDPLAWQTTRRAYAAHVRRSVERQHLMI